MRAINLRDGHSFSFAPDTTVAAIVGTGFGAYLWIGNNSDKSKHCFATVGRTKMIKLAREILRLSAAQRKAQRKTAK